jgi:hypothetical protein
MNINLGAEFEAMKGEFKPAKEHVFTVEEIEAQASELRKQHSDWSPSRLAREAVNCLNDRRNVANAAEKKARDRDMIAEKYKEAEAKAKAREDLPEVLDYAPSLKFVTTGLVTGGGDSWTTTLDKMKRFALHLFMREALHECKGNREEAAKMAQELADKFMDKIRNKPMVRDYQVLVGKAQYKAKEDHYECPDLDDEKVRPPEVENYLELREMFIPFWNHQLRLQRKQAGAKGGRKNRKKKA